MPLIETLHNAQFATSNPDTDTADTGKRDKCLSEIISPHSLQYPLEG